MKRIPIIIVMLLVLTGCDQKGPDKPEKLLSEEQMTNILYDMAVVEGIRASDYNSLLDRGIKMPSYIYKKYNIDSLQLVQNEKYYAADTDAFARIYDRVASRIEKNKREADSLAARAPSTPPEPLSLKVDTVSKNINSKQLATPVRSGTGRPRQ